MEKRKRRAQQPVRQSGDSIEQKPATEQKKEKPETTFFKWLEILAEREGIAL